MAGVEAIHLPRSPQLALRFADRGYVLENGRLALEGPARALLEDPTIRASYLGM